MLIAHVWLDENFAHIGSQSSVDLREIFDSEDEI